MKTKHYKDIDGNVYGFKPDNVEVFEMSDNEFMAFKEEQEATIKDKYELQKKYDQLYAIEAQITRFERIRDRTETEEQELDGLIKQSTDLFREIRAIEEGNNDHN